MVCDVLGVPLPEGGLAGVVAQQAALDLALHHERQRLLRAEAANRSTESGIDIGIDADAASLQYGYDSTRDTEMRATLTGGRAFEATLGSLQRQLGATLQGGSDGRNRDGACVRAMRPFRLAGLIRIPLFFSPLELKTCPGLNVCL